MAPYGFSLIPGSRGSAGVRPRPGAGLALRPLRRLAHAAVLLLVLSSLSFLLLELAPGDYLDAVRLAGETSPSTREALRSRYGLDQSLPERYGHWIASVARGDWGYSFAYGVPVRPLLWERGLNTLLLTASATLLSWLIAVPLGVGWALLGRGWASELCRLATSLLLSIPEVLLALVFLFLAAETGAFPIGGMSSLHLPEPSGWSGLQDLARHMFLPVAVLVLSRIGGLVRHVRETVGEALRLPAVRLMYASGVPTPRILLRDVLPLAANPLITLLGLSLAGLLSGSLIVEVVMGWPGLGPLLLDAILARDVYGVVGATTCSGFLLLLAGGMADLLLRAADPRIAPT
jgi:peptide/nickel transport system permease protein